MEKVITTYADDNHKIIDSETGEILQEMCEKPTPLGVGWIAQIMCM